MASTDMTQLPPRILRPTLMADDQLFEDPLPVAAPSLSRGAKRSLRRQRLCLYRAAYARETLLARNPAIAHVGIFTVNNVSGEDARPMVSVETQTEYVGTTKKLEVDVEMPKTSPWVPLEQPGRDKRLPAMELERSDADFAPQSKRIPQSKSPRDLEDDEPELPLASVVVAFQMVNRECRYSIGSVCDWDARRHRYEIQLLPSGITAKFNDGHIEELGWAELVGLEKAPHLNGVEVRICRYDAQRHRIVAELESGKRILVTADKLNYEVEAFETYWDMQA